MPRLRTDLILSAYRLKCEAAGAYVLFLTKGDASAGAIYICFRPPGAPTEIFVPAPNMDDPDERAWMSVMADQMDDPERELRLSDYLTRIRRDDPDAWIMEVESTNPDCRPSPLV